MGLILTLQRITFHNVAKAYFNFDSTKDYFSQSCKGLFSNSAEDYFYIEIKSE